MHVLVCMSQCLHSSSTTIKIDVAKNRLHHGLIEPLQRLQTERQTVWHQPFMANKKTVTSILLTLFSHQSIHHPFSCLSSYSYPLWQYSLLTTTFPLLWFERPVQLQKADLPSRAECSFLFSCGEWWPPLWHEAESWRGSPAPGWPDPPASPQLPHLLSGLHHMPVLESRDKAKINGGGGYFLKLSINVLVEFYY